MTFAALYKLFAAWFFKYFNVLVVGFWVVVLTWIAVSSFKLGYAVGNAEAARLKAQYAQAQLAAERLAGQRLKAAQAHGDTLSARLSKTESALHKKTLEVSHEVSRYTFGRACLDSRAVGLLNRASADVDAVPQAPGALDAAGGGVATDTDIAGWIAGAQGQYAVCRTRLDALIRFEEGEKQ